MEAGITFIMEGNDSLTLEEGVTDDIVDELECDTGTITTDGDAGEVNGKVTKDGGAAYTGSVATALLPVIL